MYESKHFQAVLYFVLIVIVLEGDTRRPRLREEKPPERRDYRPSKWFSNSAMDVWYGNKSMVDVLFREFNDVVSKVAMRPVRSPVPVFDVTKNNGNYSRMSPVEEAAAFFLRRHDEEFLQNSKIKEQAKKSKYNIIT